MPDVVSRVVHEPIGVCSLITPWNYPLLQTSWKVAPCLAAGNTFVLKPSELTPSTAIWLMRALSDVGLPDGVANLVLGAGDRVGPTLTEAPEVDLVSFTGGVVTGRRMMVAAAPTVKKVALELGGKNPNVVFADADLDAAIDNALTAVFLDSGQVCSAGARLVVEDTVHDRVVDELVRRAGRIRLGGPFDDDAETGPLISAAHRDKVEAYVAAGLAEGATLRVGGARPEGAAYERRVLLPAHHPRRLLRRHVVRAGGELRAGADRGALHRRGRRRPRGGGGLDRQRHRLRPGRGGVDQRRRSRRAGRVAAAARHDLDQRLPPLRRPRPSGAATSRAAPGASSGSPVSRSTARPSTSGTTPGRPARAGSETNELTSERTPRREHEELRLRHRRRRLGGLRAGQPALRGPLDQRAGARGRSQRHLAGPVHPHAGGAAVPDRQPALRLEVRVGARAAHGRAAGLPRARQGAGRLVLDQRDDLPARQPLRLRALGRRRRHGAVGLRPLPALLQADGDHHRGRRRLARRLRPAGARARSGHLAALRGVLRGRPAGRAPADRRRQRLPAGGLREVRPQRAPRPPAQRQPGLPAPGDEAQEPRRADPGHGHRAAHAGQARHRRRLRARRSPQAQRRGRRGGPLRRRHQLPAAAPAHRASAPPTTCAAWASTCWPTCPGVGREHAGPPRGLHPARRQAAGLDRAVAQAPPQAAHRRRVALRPQAASAPPTTSRPAASSAATTRSPTPT